MDSHKRDNAMFSLSVNFENHMKEKEVKVKVSVNKA